MYPTIPHLRLKSRLLGLGLIATLGASPASAQFTENEIRGFSPDKLYGFANVDAVNTFNGNLAVTIPIGGQYPVDAGFSYGLTAVYNSQVWDRDEVFDGQGGEFVDFPVVSELWNAGLGWVVGFGRLFPPEGATHLPINDTDHWLYIDPSGNKHHFYDELHADDSPGDGSATTFYSRDNSYLRLKLDDEKSPTTITVEFPNGEMHTFEKQGSEGWYPIRLEDAFGNNADIAYSAPGATWTWTITDQHNVGGEREHEILLDSDTELGFIVDSITLKAFNEQDAVYDFQYDVDQVETCYKRDPAAGSSDQPPTPLLSAIVLPAAAGSYDFADAGGDSRYHKIGCSNSQLPGALLAMRLPTRGQIEWDYGSWKFPADRAATGSAGVVARRTLEEVRGRQRCERLRTRQAPARHPPQLPECLQRRRRRDLRGLHL